MKHFLRPLLLLILVNGMANAQTVTRQWLSPTSVTIDNTGNYGMALPAVSFNQGDFSTGCLISDVDVIINWAKTAGTCSAPTGGYSYHAETSYRIDGPSNNEILALPGTWSGGVSTSSVTTTFSQGSGIPSGTPVTGTFGPNNGNLDNYNGTTPFGNWNLAAGDNNVGDPICLTWYAVKVTVAADNTPPAYTSAPSNITVNATSGICGASVSWSAPTVTDACSATVTQTGGLPSGSTFPVGQTTITYHAYDPYGNTNDHSFVVTVVDNQSPTVSCPANISTVSPNGSCGASVSFTTPTASDNCSGAGVALLSGPASGSTFPVGTTVVSFRATDASGNSTDCSFNVTVLDVEDPVISCPADINVVSTTGNCGAVINYTTPVGTDNCPSVTTTLSSGFASGSTFPSGNTTVTYLATDASGNTASCSFTVHIDPVPNGTISLSPSPICLGDPTTLTFTFTSGTPPFNVAVTDGVNTFNVNGISSGATYVITPPTSVTYSYVSIQDATGCVRSSNFIGSAQVIVTPLPNVLFTGLASVYCESDPAVSLSGNHNGGAFSGTGIADLGGGSGSFDPGTAGPTGPYDVTYTYTDINNCTDTDVQQVSVDEQSVANAGSGGSECDLNFTFSAVASVGTGTWSTVSGPGLPFFSNANSPTSLVQVSAYGTYVFKWTEVNGECSDFDQVTVNFYEVPSPDAGFGGTECDLDFVLGANPSVGVGTWTASGPGNASFAPNANDPNAVATVDAYGSYVFTWTEDNNGCTASATVNVTFDQQSVADAGSGGDECDLNFTFSAVSSIGNGSWTATGPGSTTFNATNSPTATVTVSNYGTYVFTWTETNGNCVSVDQVTVNFYEQPVADAGQGGNECDLDFIFNGTASVGPGVWTYIGPGNASFTDASDPSTIVSVDTYGTYVFTWTETNGTCSDSQNVLVNFYEQPVADAGTGGDQCDLDYTFTGTASAGTGTWTAAGPGTSNFADAHDAATDVAVSVYGTYVYTWTEVNGTCSDNASVTVNYYEQPVANAGVGGNECDLNFLAEALPSVGSGIWSQTAGPGTAAFNNASSPITNVTVDAYGTYDLTWTETNGSCSDAATITVNFYEQPVADAGNGGEECDLDFVFNAVPSVGTGLWTYSGPGTAAFVDDADPATTVTVSQSGTYDFTWTETNGTCSDAASVSVIFHDQPVADAGQGSDECDLNYTFNGSSSFGSGTWSYTGPGSAFFGNLNSPTSTVTVDAYGSYQFTWTETNGICSDNATITVNFYEQPVADAGVGGSECDLDFNLIATGSVGTGTWTYTGPGSAAITPDPNDPAPTVIVDATGTYVFTWTEDNNGCADASDVTVVFNPLPVVSFTGLAATYCIDQTAPVPLTGSPTGGTFTGLGISGNSFVPSIAGVGTIFLTYTYTDGNGCTNSETQTVDVNGLPNVSFSGLDPGYCEDDASNYTLIGAPSGGTFSGSGISGDDFTPANATPGIQTINYTYTDPFGCTSFDEQDVSVNELPVVSFIGLDPSYCENASSAALTGNPFGGSFSGTGMIGSSFSPVAAGQGLHTITYTYTDGNSCTNSISQQVLVNPLPLPVITPVGISEICDGDNITFDAGSGYSIYSWSNGQNGQTNTVDQAGTYNVTVITAEGCAATASPVQVIVNLPPVVDLGNDTTICTAASLSLDAGNAGSGYAWSTLEISQTITVTTTGAYTVQVTDQNNCVGTDDISVTVSGLLDPVIVADGPLSFCDGGVVGLDGGQGYQDYLWSTGEMTQTISVTTPGVVELQVWDEFGCNGMDEAIVSVLQLPNAVVAPGGPISVCNGDTATLSASSNFASYLWTPTGDTTSTVQVWQSGTYSVTVTDPNNGCEATSNEVELIVNTSVPPVIVASGAVEFCYGESVSLSVEPGPYNSYLWTSGSTTPSIVVTGTGDYGVTVLDANNCLDSTLLGDPLHVEVWNPQPLAEQVGDSVVVLNGPFDQYQWYFNGAPIPGATGAVYVPSESGNYTAMAWDVNGCSGSSNNVEFTYGVGIADLETLYDMIIYPNPAKVSFTLEADFGKNLDAQLSFSDVLGREVIMPESINGVSTIKREFDISSLSKGVYYVKLTTEDGSIVKTVVKD